MRCDSALFGALLAVAACASPPPAVPAAGPELVEAAPDCTPPSPYGGYVFWMDEPSVRPGASVRLTPWYTSQPGVLDPVPEGCLSINDVSGPGRLLEDGRTVQVDADAPADQHVQVRGSVGDEPISGRIVVYSPEMLPLVGYWRQLEEECAGREPMRELVFNGDRTFSATWLPFEVYKDYWGTYSFDPETSELVLTPTGGNHIPDDAGLSGVVSLDASTLVTGPGFTGSPSTGKGCDAPFRR